MADLSGMIGQIDASLAQGAPPPPGGPGPSGPSPKVQSFVDSIDTTLKQGSSSGYQGTLDALNAAIGQGDGSTPGGDGTPQSVIVQSGPTYGHTLAALDAMMKAPAGVPVTILPSAPTDDDPPIDPSLHPMTVRGGPTLAAPIAGSSPALPTGFQSPTPPQTAPASTSRQPAPDADATADPSSTAPASGPLSNTPDDSWTSGALKGAGTAVIKGLADVPGMLGGAMDLSDYLAARAQAVVQRRPADEVLKEWANAKAASAANPSWTRYLDPRNFLPSGEQIAAPVLAQTGAYQPTSVPGRLAQAGVEAATGGFLTPEVEAGKLALGGTKMAVAAGTGGAASQAATDATGSPLAGIVAGLGAPAVASGIGAGIRGAARLAAPVAAGSRVLNATPIIGSALQAGREAAVADKLLGQSNDPAALKAWAATPADPSEVPDSPRTTAGAVGNDPGLYQAEKDARNVNNARPTPTVTVGGQTYGGQSFNGIDRAQSDAQIAALQSGVQPDADVFRPGALIRSRMDAIDAAAQDAEDRLTAAHQDAVSNHTAAGQAFAADQQSGLAQRTADRQQAGADFADQQRSDLASRTADRVQAAADDASQAQASRDDAHARLVQGFADARAQQLQTAQDHAALLGEPVNAEDLGSTLRGAVEAVRSDAKGLHRDLYKAVDPDGTLALVATPVADRASSIVEGLKANGAELTPVEAPLFRRAAALPDVATYGTLHALDTDVGAAMSAERRTAGESPAWARLTQLKGSVKDAMFNAVDNQTAHESRLVAAGQMAPEDTLAARVQQEFDAVRSEQPLEARAAVGADYGAGPTARAAPYPGADGAEGSVGGRLGNASGDQGLSPSPRGTGSTASQAVGPDRFTAPFHDDTVLAQAPQRPDMPRPQSLHDFVRRNGGVQDPGGDIESMGLGGLIAKPGQGLHPDKMREAAAEAGYLGGDTAAAVRGTNVNDLLDALENGHRRYSVHDDDALHAWDRYDLLKSDYDRGRADSEGRSSFGVKPAEVPLSAYGRDDINGPSGLPAPDPARSGLVPTFDRAANERLRAANAAYSEYAKTYKQGPVAAGLRTAGYAGQYARSDAAFIKAAVRPGTEGYENTRAFLRAAKNDPDAVAAMHEAALNPLRRAALGPGFVPPKALENWKASYGPALRALDEVTPGFSSRFDDAGHATQTLLDMGAEHKAAIDTARKEAARQAIIDNATRKTQLGQANATDKATVADLISERTANDRAATQADKASTSTAVSDRTASDRAAIAQSRADTSAGIAQARGIARSAHATPSAQFAAKGGTGIASTEVENAVATFMRTGTTGATRMRGLVQSVSHDPEALSGLQKAGVDWIVRNHTNTDGTLSGAKLIGFLKQNRDSLAELFPHDQLTMMGAVARDAEAGARWRTTTAIKGGSDSVKNLLAAAAEGHRGPHATLGMVAVEAVAQGFEHAGLEGAAYGGAGAAALYMMNAMRQAGIRRTSNLYMAALTDPELARTLISKMPTKPDSSTMLAFSRSLKRSLILGPMAIGQSAPSDRQRAAAQ